VNFSFLRPEVLGAHPYVLNEPPNAQRMHQNESVPLTEAEKDELSGVAARLVREGKGVNCYPSLDAVELRSALSDLYGVPAACVEPISGSSQGLLLLSMACFSPGRSVAVPRPAFSIYEHYANLFGARVVPIPLSLEKTHFCEYLPEALLSPEVLQANVVLLCNPNNPTGSVLDENVFLELLRRARGLVVVDEAYIEFCPNLKSAAELVVRHKNLLVLRTLSKAWGLAGLRLGAMVACPELMTVFRTLKPPYSFSLFSEGLSLYVLRNWQAAFAKRVEHILKEKEKMRAVLAEIVGVTLAPSFGNFACFVHPKAEKLERELRDSENILIRRYTNAPGHPLFGMCRVNVWDDGTNAKFRTVAQKVLTAN
jgi:histidinol-phosphate aminotransferase